MGLTSKDIMVGDFVCGILGNMRVVSIGKTTVTGQWVDKDDPELIHETNCVYDHVHPIPLTAEIMQLNNIKEVYKSSMSKVWDIDYGDDYDISVRYSISNKLCLVAAMDLKKCAEVRKHIRYVHELQHALRILGLHLGERFKVE